MADWKVTARVAGGKRFHLVGGDEWRGHAGAVYTSLAGLEEAHGPSQPAEVAGLPALVAAHADAVAEAELLTEANTVLAGRLLAAGEDAAQVPMLRHRLAVAQRAVHRAGRALASVSRRCERHGADLRAGAACCTLPALVVAALDAVAAATPPATPPGETTDPRGNQPAPAGVGHIIEKEH